jgi:hypothetical protein
VIVFLLHSHAVVLGCVLLSESVEQHKFPSPADRLLAMNPRIACFKCIFGANEFMKIDDFD